MKYNTNLCFPKNKNQPIIIYDTHFFRCPLQPQATKRTAPPIPSIPSTAKGGTSSEQHIRYQLPNFFPPPLFGKCFNKLSEGSNFSVDGWPGCAALADSPLHVSVRPSSVNSVRTEPLLYLSSPAAWLVDEWAKLAENITVTASVSHHPNHADNNGTLETVVTTLQLHSSIQVGIQNDPNALD